MMPTMKVGQVRCPFCHEMVNVYMEPGEVLDDAKPVKCPDDKTVLNDVIARKLGLDR